MGFTQVWVKIHCLDILKIFSRKTLTQIQSPNIYLYNADIFDCHMKDRKSTYCETDDLDPTRVSFYTSKILKFYHRRLLQ